jgi:hypothetical protein
MPDVRMARPLLEQDMNKHTQSQESLAEGESMIDARQASYTLRLPYYWFADPKMRAAKRIPHYQLSRLVRFRFSELEVWYRQNGRVCRTGKTGTEGNDD